MNIKRIMVYIIVCLMLLSLCYIIYDINCTHGVYEIKISEKCIYNNSVGNDWVKFYTMDGENISSGERVIVRLGAYPKKKIKATIKEIDEWSDISSKDISFKIQDKGKTTSTIKVVENNGRFKGNIAEWEITVSIKLVKKVI